MELALYDSYFGYYARAAQRSGRAGDFFTSVDVGPLFGELLARQIIEMAALLRRRQSRTPLHHSTSSRRPQATDGLRRDMLRCIRRRDPAALRPFASSSRRSQRRGPRGRSARRSATSGIGLRLHLLTCRRQFAGVLRRE